MISTKRNWPGFNHSLYLTDGGLETSLIFTQGVSLNHFSAFELLNTEQGRDSLKEYYQPYLELAVKSGLPFVLETPTWRASGDWGGKLGYTNRELFSLNTFSVQYIHELAQPYKKQLPQIIFSGNIGPRGDGYKANNMMTASQATDYHYKQVKAFALAGADIVTALTINYTNEAIGIINAARRFHLPVVVSFTVETDGKLPGSDTLQDAIEKTDKATDGYATHFMINCAHPDHFLPVLQTDGEWKNRIMGIRANASAKSHTELDESTTLDAGDKCHLATKYQQLSALLPKLKVIGGCCGTDIMHLEEMRRALQPASHSKLYNT